MVYNKYENNICCRFYKLIIMDIDMPIKNGFQASKEIINFYDEK